MCSTGKISNVFTYFMSPWKKNRISYLETLGYALWFPFRFNDSCHHIMLDFTGTRKQTSLKINKQLNERFLIHGVMLSLWKTSKIQNIMFPLIFAMLLLDSKLLYSLSCEEYVNLFFWIFHISNSIWLIFFFCSRNGTCCYLHKWDTEQGKCILK